MELSGPSFFLFFPYVPGTKVVEEEAKNKGFPDLPLGNLNVHYLGRYPGYASDVSKSRIPQDPIRCFVSWAHWGPHFPSHFRQLIEIQSDDVLPR